MTSFDLVFQILTLAWVGILLLAGPLNAFLGQRSPPDRVQTRPAAYLSAARGLTTLTAITFVVDIFGSNFGVQALLKSTDAVSIVSWTILTTALCLAISVAFLGLRKTLRVRLPSSVARLMPRTRTELFEGVGVSIVAGMTEEYMYRGFCLLFLISATGSSVFSFLLVTLAFGVGHGYQDLIGVARASLAAAALALPVLVLGSLLPAIAAHIAIDAFAFLIGYTSFLERWGLVPEPTAPLPDPGVQP